MIFKETAKPLSTVAAALCAAGAVCGEHGFRAGSRALAAGGLSRDSGPVRGSRVRGPDNRRCGAGFPRRSGIRVIWAVALTVDLERSLRAPAVRF